jgi:hypothetical protein
MAKHPLGLQFARGWEVDFHSLLLTLAALLTVGHDDREPVEQAVSNCGQLLGLALCFGWSCFCETKRTTGIIKM